MDKTTRLNLNLPGSEDYADVALLNENFAALDRAALVDPATGKLPLEDVPVLPLEDQLAAAAVKDAPVDGDAVAVADSADGGKVKRVLLANIAALLKGTFYDKAAVDAALSDKVEWNKTFLNANDDLNTLIAFGPYAATQSVSASIQHSAISDPFFMFVFPADDTGNRILQVQTRSNHRASRGAMIFYRKHVVDFEWSEWTSIATDTDLAACAKTPIKLTASVPVASWAMSGTCYQQTVAVAGLLATDDLQNAEIFPVGNPTDPAAQVLTDEAYGVMAGPGGGAWCNVNGQLLMRCPPGNTKPAVTFSIAIAVVR